MISVLYHTQIHYDLSSWNYYLHIALTPVTCGFGMAFSPQIQITFSYLPNVIADFESAIYYLSSTIIFFQKDILFSIPQQVSTISSFFHFRFFELTRSCISVFKVVPSYLHTVNGAVMAFQTSLKFTEYPSGYFEQKSLESTHQLFVFYECPANYFMHTYDLNTYLLLAALREQNN